jgi:ABC-type multidrug transport system ATPase subunit
LQSNLHCIPNMPSVVNVSNLSKLFGPIRAVDGLSFSVNSGDIYVFLGQNGAGKSTMIRMLLTLIEPTSGEIEIFGMKLRSHRKEILRHVGAVIERPDLYKYLSAYENISLFAKMSGAGISKKRIMDQLEQVGIAERAHSKVKTFSLGMKQRLGIAIALINDPQLVILDEPTNGLDPQGIADIRNLILDLSKHQKRTVIDNGKKMVEGNVSDLFDPSLMIVELQTMNTAQTLAAISNSSWKTALQKQQKDTFILKMDRKEIPFFTSYMVQHGIEILSIQPRHSLEDYFLSLTSAKPHVETFTN